MTKLKFSILKQGLLKNFLGMEIERNDSAISVSERKYTLDLLMETVMMGSKQANTPMDSNVKLEIKNDEDPVDKGRYQRLVGKLIYLSHTLHAITFSELCESIYALSIQQSHEGSLPH